MTTFERHLENGLAYYTIPAFRKTGLVIHGFSGRSGGVSQGVYESLNLSILTQDKREDVLENRKRFTGALGITLGDLVGAHQVHEDQVRRVTKAEKGRGSRSADNVIPATDALMTDEPGLALTAFFADCVPVFFLDPVHKAIALAHAGWKGTVAKIAAKTALAMQEAFRTKPKDLLAAIGPSIGPCHYEVDEPVINRFKRAFPKEAGQILSPETKPGRCQLDLWQANYVQLIDSGVPAGNITIAGLCTYCMQEEFFSHRAGMAGRQAALLMLKG